MSVLSLLKKVFNRDLNFVDVGAYLGDFSEEIVRSFPGSRGLLYEPTPETYAKLNARFCSNSSIQTVQAAVSNRTGTAEFYLAEDAATNSLLRFHSEPQNHPKASVSVVTLDEELGRNTDLWKVDLLKIDTQGNDLKVLLGAQRTLEKDQPVVLLETIFLPLYRQQDNYFEIWQFFAERAYHVAGIYNAHYTEDGILAFSDFLFVPARLIHVLHRNDLSRGRFVCTDSETLLAENKNLLAVCAERLELIQRLDGELRKLMKRR